MRGKLWRRHKQEYHTKRRLKITISSWGNWRWIRRDVNHNPIQNLTISNCIGLDIYFIAKTISTNKHDSRRKIKYSPNKSKGYYRDHKIKDTREYQRKMFLKELKENGIV